MRLFSFIHRLQLKWTSCIRMITAFNNFNSNYNLNDVISTKHVQKYPNYFHSQFACLPKSSFNFVLDPINNPACSDKALVSLLRIRCKSQTSHAVITCPLSWMQVHA